MNRIGFIGLGMMGKPMALNLLKAGYSVSIYARRAEAAELFVNKGATAYPSPRELAQEVDVIITNLPTTADVEEVLLGKKGVCHGAKPGTIVIDMSTISAYFTQIITKRLAEFKIEMLDAPVSGGEQGAIDASLTIMVGGEKSTLKKVKPILETLGKQIIHIGDHGTGQVAKACNQLVHAETIIAMDEAIRLARASKVDPSKVREVLLGSHINSHILDTQGKRMLENNYTAGFKASLHRKDLHLVVEQAQQVSVNIPAAKYAMKCLDRLVLKGHSDLDSSAIHLITED